MSLEIIIYISLALDFDDLLRELIPVFVIGLLDQLLQDKVALLILQHFEERDLFELVLLLEALRICEHTLLNHIF